MLQWNHSQLGSPATDLRAKLPACYSQEFDDCLTEYRRAVAAKVPPKPSAYCNQYYPVIAGTTDAIWDEALLLVPYCPGGTATQKKTDSSGIWPALGIIGVIGGVFALAVNATGSRF